MQDENSVVAIGTLTKDAELRYSPGGLAILNFTVAGTTTKHRDTGELGEFPFYIQCTQLGSMAEKNSEFAKTGTKVFVAGGLEFQEWKDAAQKRKTKVSLKATRLELGGFASEHEVVVDSKGGIRLLSGMNSVLVTGRLTSDPRFQTTSSGAAVCNGVLAINESWQDKQGNWHQKAHFVEFTAWRELATKLSQALKGAVISLRGEITNKSWEDKETHEMQYRTYILASDGDFIITTKADTDPGAKPNPTAKKKEKTGEDYQDPNSLDELDPEDNLPF